MVLKSGDLREKITFKRPTRVSNGSGGFTTTYADILKEGGTDIDINFTTFGIMNETIKIAICRMAAGLYIFRENIVESKYNYKDEIDESRKMIKSISNITLF